MSSPISVTDLSRSLLRSVCSEVRWLLPAVALICCSLSIGCSGPGYASRGHYGPRTRAIGYDQYSIGTPIGQPPAAMAYDPAPPGGATPTPLTANAAAPQGVSTSAAAPAIKPVAETPVVINSPPMYGQPIYGQPIYGQPQVYPAPAPMFAPPPYYGPRYGQTAWGGPIQPYGW